MAPRSIWNGTVTFGLVNVPIKLYTATESKTVHFNEVHAKDGARIEHRRICPKEDKEVSYEEVVKGYEVEPDKYVVLQKEELKAAAGDRGKVVHLSEFVETTDVDPVFYEKTYYVGSRDDADPYRLLHEALKRSGRAGIGRFTFHDREYLVALRALDDILALDTLRFHDEVVEAADLDMPRALWSGSLSFGLVNVPVQVVTAARDLDYHFTQLHEKDKVRIEQRRFCAQEDIEVPWEEIAHAYDLDGKQVVVSDDELGSVQ